MPLPDICVEDRAGCLNEWPTVRLQQQVRMSVTVQLRDIQGHIYPLDTDLHRVYLVTKQSFTIPQLEMVVEAEIIDGPEGVIEISVDEEDTQRPGILLGEFIVFDVSQEDSSSSSSVGGAGDSSSSSVPAAAEAVVPAPILQRFPAFVEVHINLQNLDSVYNMGSITIGELRLMIRDKCAVDNFLLDHVEFSDTEIAWAIRRPIDLWNEQPPAIFPHTPSTFPYRYYWLNGAVGELLVTAGVNYERNDLTYAAANLSIADKAKSQFYMKAGQAMKGEYFQWVLREKKRLNMEQLYGTTNLRAYGNRGYFGNSLYGSLY